MNEERFIELMGEESGKWDGDNAYKGCQIISKYTDNVIHGASHDIIYSADISDLIEAGITEEDVKELRRLNWMLEEECYLACFV